MLLGFQEPCVGGVSGRGLDPGVAPASRFTGNLFLERRGGEPRCPGGLSEHPGVGCLSEDLACFLHRPRAPGARARRAKLTRASGTRTHTRTSERAHPPVRQVCGARGWLDGEEVSSVPVGPLPGSVPRPLLRSGRAFLRPRWLRPEQPSNWSLLGGQLAGTLTSKLTTWALQLPDGALGATPGPQQPCRPLDVQGPRAVRQPCPLLWGLLEPAQAAER